MIGADNEESFNNTDDEQVVNTETCHLPDYI